MRDMNPLTLQVHTATKLCSEMLTRLADQEFDDLQDDLVSFAGMHARINNVLKALAHAEHNIVNERGEEAAPTEMGADRILDISGKEFAMGAAMPNVFFHVSMAYAILRKENVPLGKKDYLLSFVGEHITAR